MDRFLLAQNPHTRDGIFIIQSIRPILVIEVVPGHIKYHEVDYKWFYHKEGRELYQYTLTVHYEFLEEHDPTLEKAGGKYEKIQKILDRAWHWYQSCLELQGRKDYITKVMEPWNE